MDDTDSCGALYLPRAVREFALDSIADTISNYEHLRGKNGMDVEFDSEC
jgi:hypothetical protein